MDLCKLFQVDFNRVMNILVVNEWDLPILEEVLVNKVNIVNIYDCSEKIEAYNNPEIIKFHNIHQGERCFIIATGPSLNIRDLEKLKLKNEICISMNSIWKGFTETSWRPDYYIADDPRVMINDEEVLENMTVRYIFLGDTCDEYWKKKHKHNILWHHFVYEYSEDRLPKFSKDFSKKCYMGATVTYSCIQLAVYMGFKEIYLLGADFSYAFSSGDMKYSHFYEEKELKATGFVKQVTLAYLKAKKYADEHGIKIYNATRGGKLEIFERVDFDKVLF